MPRGDAARIRAHVVELADGARAAGETGITVRAGDIREALGLDYRNAVIDICQVLGTRILQGEAGVEPLPAKPGRPRREDYDYLRAGTRNLFLSCEPLADWRHGAITQQRPMKDFAHQMRWLVDEAYPAVPMIQVVLDNLNTHQMASLYETFPAAEARRIAKRLEFHHTPEHGSWLNPVLSLPKGWRRSSSASWPGLACADVTPTETASIEPSAPACRSGTRQGPPLLAVHCPRRQTQTHRLYPCQS